MKLVANKTIPSNRAVMNKVVVAVEEATEAMKEEEVVEAADLEGISTFLPFFFSI